LISLELIKSNAWVSAKNVTLKLTYVVNISVSYSVYYGCHTLNKKWNC
jgi:hypothetical protein